MSAVPISHLLLSRGDRILVQLRAEETSLHELTERLLCDIGGPKVLDCDTVSARMVTLD